MDISVRTRPGKRSANRHFGALVSLGIPEEEAQFYEGEFHAGRTLVTVRTDRYDEAWAILCRHGAYRRETAGTASAG